MAETDDNRPGWQPIETPPDHDDEVLVLSADGSMEIGYWRLDAKGFDSYNIGWLEDATHWMPLPNPPTEHNQ